MMIHSVAQGISSLSRKNAYMGQLLNIVCMVMVDNGAYTGSITKNPFNFNHFSASQVAIYLNGKISTTQLKPNVADQYIDGYRSLFATARPVDMDIGLDIKRAGYKSGYCIFGYDTLPLFVRGNLKNGKEMEFCEKIYSLQHLHLTL